MMCTDKGATLKGKKVVVIFQTHTRFRVLHASSRDKATSVYFKGNSEKPVICTIEKSYHNKIALS